MQDAKEEVRSRVAIEDVIGEYVQLKRAGRNFKGLSPFTGEKTPSFVVSPEKNIWHDFSSGRGGDVFTFVMEVEGLDFRAALELLARKAGVELADYDTKKAGEIAARKKRLLEANQLAAKYYQQSLIKNPHAQEYVFEKRRLNKEIVQAFQIGYAPDNDALTKILAARGFTKQEISAAGLSNRFGGDLFRGRMMIALMDASGQVIGFTGRILADIENAPKYLNTPQTLIYDKSRHVFGLSQAKPAIRVQDTAVIVEGNMDVIASHQAGVGAVVATAGTAMTEWHIKALARLTPNISLAFDNDKAGLAATERAIPIAQRVGVELTIVTLSNDAKDPDELIQQDVRLWQEAINTAMPVVDWVLKQYSLREDLTTAAGKRQFTTAALEIIRHVNDEVEREHYLKHVATMTSTSLATLAQKMHRNTDNTTTRRKTAVVNGDFSGVNQQYNYQDDCLAALLQPSVRSLIESFDTSLFVGKERQLLADYLKNHSRALETIPKELHHIETYVKIVQLKAETRYEAWSEPELQLEVARLLRQTEIDQKKQTTEQLLVELREAEAAEDELRAEELRAKLHRLIKETRRG